MVDEEAESEPRDVEEGSAGWVEVERGVRPDGETNAKVDLHQCWLWLEMWFGDV